MAESHEMPRNLPRLPTPFVGRDQELAETSALLEDPTCRLLTLVGPGGVGKTRLALEIASRMRERFEDGVCVVPLQAVQQAEHMAMAIVGTLPLHLSNRDDPRQHLLDYLRQRRLLLVLDNFEHLLDGVALLTDLLAIARQVKLVVTSRERLNLQAEQVWPVRGLDFPESGSPYILNQNSAAQLFMERAQRVQPSFSPETQEDDLVRICQLVEGLPLALELAAAWTRVLDCKTIADEIKRNLDVLMSKQHDLPERHQSMRAVFDQSWCLLTDEEQDVLPKLAVFRGGFTLDAAKHVAAASLHTLASLVDKSLVQVTGNGRYDLHELLRQYEEEILNVTGMHKDVRNAHMSYYTAFVFNRVDDLKGRRQIEAIAELDADYENVRSAWMNAMNNRDAEAIDQMIDGLWTYFRNRNRDHDAREFFRFAEQEFSRTSIKENHRLWERLLARSVDGETAQRQLTTALDIAMQYDDSSEIAFCLAQSGHVAYANKEYDKAVGLFEQSLTIYRQLGDRYHIADVLFYRLVYDHQSDWDFVKYYRDEMLRLQHEIGDRVGLGRSLAPAAINEGRLGHFSEAERLWLERVALGYETGNPALVAVSYGHLSHRVFFFQGDFAQAREAADEAIKIGTPIGMRTALGWALSTLGLLASMNEDYAEGRQLCQQAATIDNFVDIGKYAAWGLAIAACGYRDFETAYTHLEEALWYLTNILGTVGDIASLPVVAIICAHQDQPVRAVELLALALTHPVGASGWMEKWPLLERLQADLEHRLGPEAYSAAWENGKRLNIDSVIDELRTRFLTVDSSAHEQANQRLVDPLSPREIEVLVLIADGLTNQEIADTLYIGVSTVKKHINHIFNKLDVTHRAQAVSCARTRGILP